MVLAGLAIGGGLGYLDKLSQDKAEEAQAELVARLLGQLGNFDSRSESTAFGRQRRRFDQAESAQRRSIGVAKQGTEKALGETALVQGEANRQINQAGKLSTARLDASLGRRGLYNSSGAGAGRTAIVERSQNALQAVAARLASLRSGIIQRGAAAEQSGLQGLAHLSTQRSAAENALLMRRLAIEGDEVHQPGSILSAIGGGQGIAALLSGLKKG